MPHREKTRLMRPFWPMAAGAAALVVVALSSLSARADVVRLVDGSSLEGTVKHKDDGWDVTDASGKVVHVAAESVQKIELQSKGPSGDEVLSRLLSLRRACENLTDLKAIIERYARFVDQYKDTPAGKEAARDLAEWQRRADQRMVKVGPHWVTPAEREALLDRNVRLAEAARALIAQARFREADAMLQQAMEIDPAHVSANYLRGFLLAQQQQLQPAQRSFEAVVAAMKDHAPSLNNLAVVLWRQNQSMAALNQYDRAMAALPGKREILDNVAEALAGVQPKDRNNAIVVRVQRHFAEQDAVLQAQLQREGLYRWGSTWVGRAQYEQLKAAEAEVQKKLDGFSAEFDAAKRRIDQLESDTNDNLRRMHAIEATCYAVDPQGRVFRLPLPQRYYDLEDDNKAMAQDRAKQLAKMDALRAAAKQAQQQLPTPKFSGTQQLIGVEGMPAAPAAGAGATIPSTQSGR